MDCVKVSLVIPVYNVRDYLKKCLDSVAAQTYENLEVIIVNDGSTDDSLDIINDYTARFENMTCYTIENRGLGGARNFGTEKSTGEYITFLDSDDYIDSAYIEKMVTAAVESGSDIAVCNNHDVSESGEILFTYHHPYKNAVTSLAEDPTLLFNRLCAWGKLYKRDLFNELEYVSRVWYEDMRLTPKLFLKAEKICFVEDCLVYYVQRAGSIMNNNNVKRNLEIIDAFKDVIDYFKDCGSYASFKNELEFLVIEHIAVAAITRVAQAVAEDKKDVLQKLNDYLNGFEGLYNNPYLKSQERNRKIILWLNKHKLYAATKLVMKLKSAL